MPASRAAYKIRTRPLQPIGKSGPVNSLAQILRVGALVLGAGALLMAFSGTSARAAPKHQAKPAAASSEGFSSFIARLWPDAQARGVSRATFDAAFEGVTPSASVLGHTKKQAEFVKPVWSYLTGAVTPQRIASGRAKASELASVLENIERKYGVDRYVVLGVWGMETSYGGFTGSDSVIRALATLAHAGYRGDFFRNELLAALVILEQQHVGLDGMRGSWAGAMGQTQFMPTSFLKYAVDYNGDGRKNIWTSQADALASTANYLAQHGWTRDWIWGYEVTLPEGFDVSRHDPATYRNFANWAQTGIRRADGEAMPNTGDAALLLPAGLRGPAFLVTPNFKVIKTYNNSTAYALGVAILGDRIAGAGPLKGSWPRGDKPLNSAQSLEIQKRLKAMGYEVGDLDGKLGEKAQDAIRQYQRKAGVLADGYPTHALLERMRKPR